MRLKSLEIDGFRSFQTKQELTFPERSGLFFIRGRNEMEPRLGANGSGKTTTIDAVSWCWYGSTSRGLKAGNVESWGNKHTDVLTVVEVNGIDHTIERTRHPITLQLDGEEVEQYRITELLGLTYERFLQVCLMGQFGVMFADMKPTARLELVSGVLELEIWARAAKTALKTVQRLQGEMQDFERIIHGLECRIEENESSKAELLESSGTWAAGQEESIKKAEELAETSAESFDQAEGDRRKATGRVANCNARSEAVEKLLGAVERTRTAHKKSHAEYVIKVSRAQGSLEAAEYSLSKVYSDLHGGECPTCQQNIEEEYFKEIEAEAESIVGLRKGDHRKAKESEKSSGLTLAGIERQLEERVSDFDELEAELDTLEAASRFSRHAVTAAKNSRDNAKREVDRLKAQENPLKGQLDHLEKRLLADEEELNDQRILSYSTITEHDLSKDWPKHFKELRLWLVDSALDELAANVDGCLVALGLVGWRIEFVVEKETKSGTTSRGFEILIYSPMSPGGTPWEAWSGGETQRLRVACSVGLASLIRSKMPSPPDFEIWDEPTEHLNKGGVDDLIDFFSARADEYQIWLIDHRSLDSGNFDGVLTVVKGEQGSELDSSRLGSG